MLIYNELPLPFPWYDALQKQNRFRENCGSTCDFELITPRSSLLPFQFRREKSATLLTRWQIMYLSDTEALDITRNITLVNAKTVEGNDYFFYGGEALQVDLEPGNTQALDLPPGKYYSVLSAGSETYYSEVFTIPEKPFSAVESVNIPYLKIEWTNPGDLRPILYNTATGFRPAFKNVLYLDTFVTTSEPRLEEETIEDGNGTEIPIFQKLAIEYRFSVVAPDYIKLALAALQIHKTVKITTPKGVRVGDVARFSSVPTVEDDGCLSTLDCVFEQDIVLYSTNCDANMAAEPCGPLVPPTITSAVEQPGGQIKLTGVAPLDAWLEVYASATETGTYFKIHPGLSSSEFIAGNALLSDAQAGDFFWFKVVALNFNCNYGQSAPILKT